MKIGKNKSHFLLLFIILVFASILRLWNLANVPPSLTPDEASLGYNAYSLLKTGRDEYGQSFPIIFKSFGDYKPGLYVYTAVPFIALLGLSEWSVRLPSVIAGILAVFLLYKIVELLFLEKYKEGKIYSSLPLLSAFILALSPWHIHFSRGAWEINLSLTLTLLGIYFLLKAFRNPVYMILSAISFALTFLAYQGAKLSTTLVILAIILSHYEEIKSIVTKNLLYVIISGFLAILICLPIVFSFFGQTGRLNVFSVFSYPRPPEYLQTFLDEGGEHVGDANYFLYHSEFGNFTRGVMGRWFNHYSGRFLFFEGDWQNPKHSAPYHGVLTLFDLLLFIFGMYFLARNIRHKPVLFIGVWLLLAPLPAALSRDSIHAVRAFTMVIPLTIVLAFGLSWIISLLRSIPSMSVRSAATIPLVFAYSISYLYFLDMYFLHLPIQSAKAWDYGYKQIVEVIKPIKDNYETIKIQQSFAQPYIYFLFYLSYDPASYQRQAELVPSEFKNDVGYITQVDNISFTGINWPENRGEKGTLFVGDDIRIPTQDSIDPNQFAVKGVIFYPDGTRAFRIIEVK